jgi:hypothetical protein
VNILIIWGGFILFHALLSVAIAYNATSPTPPKEN